MGINEWQVQIICHIPHASIFVTGPRMSGLCKSLYRIYC